MSQPVRIPADVDREDRVIANLTARQVLLLTVTAILLYGGWSITRTVVPLGVFLILAVPVGAAAVLLVLGQRDGITLDRLVLAAIRQRLSPRHQVAAPEGVRPAPPWLTSQVDAGDEAAGSAAGICPAALRLPAKGVTETGVVDLGRDGLAVIAVASTVNFALRSPAEHEALVASFGRYLHSLTAPVQVLIRTERLDLSSQIGELRQAAGGLPHPALETAAAEHADYLTELGGSSDLLRRQVLLVLREPLGLTGPPDALGGTSALGGWAAKPKPGTPAGHSEDTTRHAAQARLVRRLTEAAELLSPAGIVVTALDAGQTTAVLAASCNPDSLIPPSAGLAGADEVITAAPAGDNWQFGCNKRAALDERPAPDPRPAL
ncbi:MAG TPA: PrgI family protein [Pseudonocardiaceae bacterium]|nr:PrgI family protein [Pseudonocardiaceae bacterium]